MTDEADVSIQPTWTQNIPKKLDRSADVKWPKDSDIYLAASRRKSMKEIKV
jgi:hypothetical protein